MDGHRLICGLGRGWDSTNDNDRSLSGNLVVRWDMDASVDSDGDGDYRNDWDWNPLNWDEEEKLGLLCRFAMP